MKRNLGDGYEVDDDRARIDRDAHTLYARFGFGPNERLERGAPS